MNPNLIAVYNELDYVIQQVKDEIAQGIKPTNHEVTLTVNNTSISIPMDVLALEDLHHMLVKLYPYRN